MLEQQMQELRDLPVRVSGVESQILQLRHEIGVEFSAVRSELRGEMRQMRDDLRTEIHEVRQDLRTEMHGLRDELRNDIRIGVEESQNLAKLLSTQASAELHQAVGQILDRLLDLQRRQD